MVCYKFFSFQCTIPISAKSVLYLKKFKVLLLLFLRWDVIQAWRKKKLNNIFYMAVGVCDAPDTLLRFVPPSRHRFKKIGTCAHVVAKCLVWYVTELPFCNQCPSVIFAKQQFETCVHVTSHFNLCVFNSIFPPSSRPVAICAIRFSIRRKLNNWLSMILCREIISRSYFVTYLNFIFTRFFFGNCQCPSLIFNCPQLGFHFNWFCVKEIIISRLWSGMVFSFLQLNLKLVSFHFKNLFNYLNKVICRHWISHADI